MFASGGVIFSVLRLIAVQGGGLSLFFPKKKPCKFSLSLNGPSKRIREAAGLPWF